MIKLLARRWGYEKKGKAGAETPYGEVENTRAAKRGRLVWQEAAGVGGR